MEDKGCLVRFYLCGLISVLPPTLSFVLPLLVRETGRETPSPREFYVLLSDREEDGREFFLWLLLLKYL